MIYCYYLFKSNKNRCSSAVPQTPGPSLLCLGSFVFKWLSKNDSVTRFVASVLAVFLACLSCLVSPCCWSWILPHVCRCSPAVHCQKPSAFLPVWSILGPIWCRMVWNSIRDRVESRLFRIRRSAKNQAGGPDVVVLEMFVIFWFRRSEQSGCWSEKDMKLEPKKRFFGKVWGFMDEMSEWILVVIPQWWNCSVPDRGHRNSEQQVEVSVLHPPDARSGR